MPSLSSLVVPCCSWDVLVENLVDPSHVNHAHHSIQGNRRVPSPCIPVRHEHSSGAATAFCSQSRGVKHTSAATLPAAYSNESSLLHLLETDSSPLQWAAGTQSWAGTSS